MTGWACNFQQRNKKKKALEVDVKCSPFFFTFFSMKAMVGGDGYMHNSCIY